MSIFSLLSIGLLGVAGACGAVTRFVITYYVKHTQHLTFPVATLFINVTGSFLIGWIYALGTQHLLDKQLQTLLATGFLGGYTTFSTMTWEESQLAREGRHLARIVYLCGNVFLGLAATIGGLLLGGWH